MGASTLPSSGQAAACHCVQLCRPSACNLRHRRRRAARVHEAILSRTRMHAEDSIERLLERLERQLLEPQARKSGVVSELLAEEFVEFGSSGRQFNRAKIVAALQVEASVQVTASQFKVQLLSPQVALVTYRAQRHSEPPVNTLRSSVWRQREGQWQLVFHQGTPTTVQT